MRPRSTYAIVGLIIGAAVDFSIDLLSASIQQQPLGAQLTNQSSIVWLIAFIIVGLLLGYWLGGPVKVPASATPQAERTPTGKFVTITRFKALLSYGKLRGQGIHLSDILLIGSRLDIDTKD